MMSITLQFYVIIFLNTTKKQKLVNQPQFLSLISNRYFAVEAVEAITVTVDAVTVVLLAVAVVVLVLPKYF